MDNSSPDPAPPSCAPQPPPAPASTTAWAVATRRRRSPAATARDPPRPHLRKTTGPSIQRAARCALGGVVPTGLPSPAGGGGRRGGCGLCFPLCCGLRAATRACAQGGSSADVPEPAAAGDGAGPVMAEVGGGRSGRRCLPPAGACAVGARRGASYCLAPAHEQLGPSAARLLAPAHCLPSPPPHCVRSGGACAVPCPAVPVSRYVLGITSEPLLEGHRPERPAPAPRGCRLSEQRRRHHHTRDGPSPARRASSKG